MGHICWNNKAPDLEKSITNKNVKTKEKNSHELQQILHLGKEIKMQLVGWQVSYNEKNNFLQLKKYLVDAWLASWRKPFHLNLKTYVLKLHMSRQYKWPINYVSL